MALTVTHSTTVAVPDDGTSPIGSNEWNAAHIVSGSIELANIPSGAAGTILWSVGAGPAAWTATPTIATALGLGSVTAPVHTLDITAAGTATVAPIRLASGTNLTTAAAGAWEFDGKVFYATAAAASRQVVCAEQWLALSASYTLNNVGTLQKLFNVPANGSLTVQGATTYFFECAFQITSMSGTSGNIIFDALGAGTATITSASLISMGADTSTPATAIAVGGLWAADKANAASLVVAAVGTGMFVWVRGIIRVNASGTLIPSVTLANAAAAVVAANSWFRIWAIGAGTTTQVGNWT